MSNEPTFQFPSGPTIVSGVVHPHDVGGSIVRATEEWTLQFAFETWRNQDGVLTPNKLTIRRQVTKDELEQYMERIRAYQVLSAQVFFTGPESAQLVTLLDKTLDEGDGLLRRAAELLKPKTYEHERFGIFTLDRRVDWYVANTTWVGEVIRLNVSGTDESPQEPALLTALELWANQSSWNQRILDYAVQHLLGIKNTYWREQDDSELTPDDFKGRMSLDAVTVSPDGSFDFWYDDGDLFWGHTIQISGNLTDGPIRADIPG